MTHERVAALEALLGEAQSAHSVYEATELNGVYDEDWPRWYAQYAVDHGVADLLGHDMTADELARLLAGSWEEFKREDPKPTETWARYTARRMAEP